MKTVWIAVYKDTIKNHNDEWNESNVQVTEDLARKYFNECKINSDCEWKTYDEFMMNYTMDDTEDFYGYACKHNGILAVEHV